MARDKAGRVDRSFCLIYNDSPFFVFIDTFYAKH
jgi:hypothetical protein